MRLINAFTEIDIEEYNLSYELQYAKFIMELFSYEIDFIVNKEENSMVDIYIVKGGGKWKKKISPESFAYYIHVHIDKVIQDYVMKLNGKIKDVQIKEDVFLNTSKLWENNSTHTVPEKYKEDEQLYERYNFYLKILLTYIKTKGKDSNSSGMIQKLYGTPYTNIKVEGLELKVKKYQDKLSSCTYLAEILESLMLVENIWKLLKNMNIFLKNVNTFS